MKHIQDFNTFLNEGEGLFADAGKGSTKGIGYGTPEKAKETIKIADKMKADDPGKAVQIVNAMLNRAKYSNGQNDGMRAAIPIFQKWLKANQASESFLGVDEFILEKLWQKEVESSHLNEIEYDSSTEELTVTFNNGDRYRYYEVPKSIFREFANEKTLLGKIGAGIVKGAKKLFGKDIDEGTYGKKFWSLIRRGGYKYEKLS
jgi:hypothetical protein